MQRVIGGALGLAMGLLGALFYVRAGPALAEPVRERAAGFGLTLMVVGGVALVASVLMPRVDRLWYRKPERWRMLRGKPTHWRQWWRP